ncbi:PREDICTED: LOW QUALITY PROTEIN: F-box/LRR-repeat protein At4g29420 [Tarenaya hassleriana]|uniref:LOW QUALITY PROTEIN: F-box/LRR-repeat protein At4g29420 n=1 Tax=Tarenaya hassleriana TaxID=28532 RepID=UPI00053C6C59|nr:PREDICTED: LOW QUALITY PROTEIN: F-box/LRR-repeat protein At4g29420 [Tarenaya hassleriana]
MDELPLELAVDILSRLTNSDDLARCRAVSKTFNSIARQVRIVNLICTRSRFLKSRRLLPESEIITTPFKAIFRKLVSDSRDLQSVSIGVEKALGGLQFIDLEEDESDDLYLTDVNFVQEWLPNVCGNLEILSISDFWIQSCWRRSGVLALISSNCSSLVELELKNAWLSVEGLTEMPNLRSLTLEFIRIDDENLDKINSCFPFLQVLNLIGVGGLKEPKIHLLHLRACHWTVSNAPLSLAISAPNLVELTLKCVKPKGLVLKTPKLAKFQLLLEEANDVSFSEFQDLGTLELVSPDINRLINCIPHFGNTVRKLTVDSFKSERAKLGLETLLEAFPHIVSLGLGPGCWSEMESCLEKGGPKHRSRKSKLREIKAHIQTRDVGVTVSFIGYIIENCSGLTDMRLLKHDHGVRSKLIRTCTKCHPGVRWKWGMWGGFNPNNPFGSQQFQVAGEDIYEWKSRENVQSNVLSIKHKEATSRSITTSGLSKGRMPTHDRLFRWNIIQNSTCVICNEEEESHDHLFFRYRFSAET